MGGMPAVGSGSKVVVVLLNRQQGAQDLVAWLPPFRYKGSICYLLPDKPLVLRQARRYQKSSGVSKLGYKDNKRGKRTLRIIRKPTVAELADVRKNLYQLA